MSIHYFWSRLLIAYLARACLGKVGNDVDLLRSSERSDDFTNLENELLDEAGLISWVVLEFTKRVDTNQHA